LVKLEFPKGNSFVLDREGGDQSMPILKDVDVL
jgi:hypothetical protein